MSLLFLTVGCILLVVTYLIGVSDNLLGIASGILGSVSFIMGVIYRLAKFRGTRPSKELSYWVPRALAIVVASFAGAFMTDNVFHGRPDFWSTIPVLLMSLTPSYIILFVLAVSWNRDWLGLVLSIAMAVLFNWSVGPPGRFSWSFDPLLSAPFLFLGLLFLLSWFSNRGVHGGSSIIALSPRWQMPGIVALCIVADTVLWYVFLR
jgi:hypothetical protein